MEYLHTMVRVADLDAALRFYCEGLGLTEVRRHESEKGRFTLVFLAAPEDISIELLQEGEALTPAEPWISMENTGSW